MTRPNSETHYTLISISACVVVALLSLLPSSCGGLEKSKAAQEPGSTGPSTPPPIPNLPGYQAWTELTTTFEREGNTVTQNGCDFPRHLRVFRDGSYLAGPCHAVANDTAKGSIPAESLQRVIGYTDAIIESDPSSPQTCDAFTELGRFTVELGLQTGGTSRIYEVRSDVPLSCYRGVAGSVRPLATELKSLQESIYAGSFGPRT